MSSRLSDLFPSGGEESRLSDIMKPAGNESSRLSDLFPSASPAPAPQYNPQNSEFGRELRRGVEEEWQAMPEGVLKTWASPLYPVKKFGAEVAGGLAGAGKEAFGDIIAPYGQTPEVLDNAKKWMDETVYLTGKHNIQAPLVRAGMGLLENTIGRVAKGVPGFIEGAWGKEALSKAGDKYEWIRSLLSAPWEAQKAQRNDLLEEVKAYTEGRPIPKSKAPGIMEEVMSRYYDPTRRAASAEEFLGVTPEQAGSEIAPALQTLIFEGMRDPASVALGALHIGGRALNRTKPVPAQEVLPSEPTPQRALPPPGEEWYRPDIGVMRENPLPMLPEPEGYRPSPQRPRQGPFNMPPPAQPILEGGPVPERLSPPLPPNIRGLLPPPADFGPMAEGQIFGKDFTMEGKMPGWVRTASDEGRFQPEIKPAALEEMQAAGVGRSEPPSPPGEPAYPFDFSSEIEASTQRGLDRFMPEVERATTRREQLQRQLELDKRMRDRGMRTPTTDYFEPTPQTPFSTPVETPWDMPIENTGMRGRGFQPPQGSLLGDIMGELGGFGGSGGPMMSAMFDPASLRSIGRKIVMGAMSKFARTGSVTREWVPDFQAMVNSGPLGRSKAQESYLGASVKTNAAGLPDSFLNVAATAESLPTHVKRMIDDAIQDETLFNNTQTSPAVRWQDSISGQTYTIPIDPGLKRAVSYFRNNYHETLNNAALNGVIPRWYREPELRDMAQRAINDPVVYNQIHGGQPVSYRSKLTGKVEQYVPEKSYLDTIAELDDIQNNLGGGVTQIPQILHDKLNGRYDPTHWHLTELRKMGLENLRALRDKLDDPAIATSPGHGLILRTLDYLIESDTDDAFNQVWEQVRRNGMGGRIDALLKKTEKDPRTAAFLGGQVDPLYSKAMRMAELGSLNGIFDFVNKVSQDTAGRTLSPVPMEGMVKIAIEGAEQGTWKKMLQDKLQQNGMKYIDEGLINELNQYFRDKGNIFAGQDWATNLLRGYSQYFLSPVKAAWTVFNPKTQMANRMWNSLSVFVASGILPKEISSAVKNAIKNRDSLFRAAQEGGIVDSGILSELGEAYSSGANIEKTIVRQQGLPLTKAERAWENAKAIMRKPGELYQSGEIKGKMGIFASELKDKGYRVANGRLFKNGVLVDKFTPENIADFRSAGRTANWYLIDYSQQSRFVKTMRQIPGGSPFMTFYSDMLPKIGQMMAGYGPDGKFNAKRAMRFWMIPGAPLLYNTINTMIHQYSDAEQDQYRDTQMQGQRRPQWMADYLPDAVGDVYDRAINPITNVTKDGKPTIQSLGGVIPVGALSNTSGIMDIPTAFYGGEPLAEALSFAQTGFNKYKRKSEMSKWTTNKGQKLLEMGARSVLPYPTALYEGVKNAMQGHSTREGMPPETVPEALLRTTTPVRLHTADPGASDAIKRSEYGKMMKTIYDENKSDLIEMKRKMREGIVTKDEYDKRVRQLKNDLYDAAIELTKENWPSTRQKPIPEGEKLGKFDPYKVLQKLYEGKKKNQEKK